MNNIISIQQVEKALKVKFSAKDKKSLGAQLLKHKAINVPEGFILLPVFPISILDLRKKVVAMKLKRRLFYSEENAWYDNEDWAKEVPEAHWLLTRTAPFPGSKGKTYEEQKAMAPQGEYVASAHDAIYTFVLNFLVRGEVMMEGWEYARTSTCSSGGYLVDFGDLDRSGADVGGWKPGHADGVLGVLFARSLDPLKSGSSNLVSPEADKAEGLPAELIINGVKYIKA